MDRTSTPLWAKYLIKAAIDYLNDRGVKACLMVDNTVLKDGVLAALHPQSDDFVLCVAPGYTTELTLSDLDVTVAVRFDVIHHVVTIPYEAVRAVLAHETTGVINDYGQLNIITIPPVVYPPGAHYRIEKREAAASTTGHEETHAQPAQGEFTLVVNKRA